MKIPFILLFLVSISALQALEQPYDYKTVMEKANDGLATVEKKINALKASTTFFTDIDNFEDLVETRKNILRIIAALQVIQRSKQKIDQARFTTLLNNFMVE